MSHTNDVLRFAKKFNATIFSIMDEIKAYMNEDQKKDLAYNRKMAEMAVRIHSQTAVLEKLVQFKVFDNYHDQIVNHVDDLFLSVDYVAEMRRVGMKSEKAESWTTFITTLCSMWAQMTPAQRASVWRKLDIIYGVYLEYMVKVTSAANV